MHDNFRRSSRFSDGHEIRRAYRALTGSSRARGDDGWTTSRLTSSHQANAICGDSDLRGNSEASEFFAGREDPFGDEVDIDFPAISTVVKRIRSSFFGAEGVKEPFQAEVLLTRKQANFGARVPLAVSLSHSCPVCGGRGVVWPDLCGVCNGSGSGALPHQLELIVPPGVQHGTYLGFDITLPSSPSARVQIRISVE
jgi:hypothetical protein